MPNLKGARTCLETLEMKSNYSELGRIYGIDRRTAKKKYNGIENKTQREKHYYLDKYIDILKKNAIFQEQLKKSVYKYIQMNIDNKIGTYSNFNKYINKNDEIIFVKNKTAHVLFETDYGYT